MATLILYEFPINELVRIMLRLERLFARMLTLSERTGPIDHHYALSSCFEILDICQRGDLKGELMKALERQRTTLSAFRGNPAISEPALNAVLGEIEQAFNGLSAMVGKAGQSLMDNEWLTSIRTRIQMPGSTFEFDLPAYHLWQHLPAEDRLAHLKRLFEPLLPMHQGLRLLLRLLRENGVMQKVQAIGGIYQQNLGSKTFQLVRVRVDPSVGLVAEIAAHRLLVSVRFMQPDADFRTKASGADLGFELALCA